MKTYDGQDIGSIRSTRVFYLLRCDEVSHLIGQVAHVVYVLVPIRQRGSDIEHEVNSERGRIFAYVLQTGRKSFLPRVPPLVNLVRVGYTERLRVELHRE